MTQPLLQPRTSVYDVASYIAQHGTSKATSLKLQQLVYLAQGWSFALLNIPMFPEQFYAWSNGPVCNDLYEVLFKEYDLYQPISIVPQGNPQKLSETQRIVTDSVIRQYSALSGIELREITTKINSPWWEARSLNISSGLSSMNILAPMIGQDSIKTYYIRELIRNNDSQPRKKLQKAPGK